MRLPTNRRFHEHFNFFNVVSSFPDTELACAIAERPRNELLMTKKSRKAKQLCPRTINAEKPTSHFAFFNPHVLIALLFCATVACWILNVPLLCFSQPKAPSNVPDRTLTIAERVAYQRAIEDVYWRHRIWPKERPDPKPSLDAVMSPAQLEKKVEYYRGIRRCSKITGKSPSVLRNYRLRWTGWPGAQNSQKSCENCLRVLETIRLSLPSVWPDLY